MKLKNIVITTCILLGVATANGQSDLEQITHTLNNYIQGTANGEPNKVKEAFHKNLNLYTVAKDSLRVWRGENYISGITEGGKSNRIGRIVSIDYENNAAMAKIEIIMPNVKRIYTDYLMLLKYQNNWKIIHKSYTFIKYHQ